MCVCVSHVLFPANQSDFFTVLTMTNNLRYLKGFFGLSLLCIGIGVFVWYQLGKLRLITGFPIPWLLRGLGSILSIPLVLTFRVLIRELSARRNAHRHGALLPPQWKGRSIGNIDLLMKSIKDVNEGYPGMSLDVHAKASTSFPLSSADNYIIGEPLFNQTPELGPLIDSYFLWDHTYFAADPEIIKVKIHSD